MENVKELLESAIGKKVAVALDADKNPSMCTMKGPLGRSEIDGWWTLELTGLGDGEGGKVPSGKLHFHEHDLVRLYVMNSDGPAITMPA